MMSNQEWLSLAEIARRWSEETGESAEALERDLQAWFSAFVDGARARSSEPPADGGDTTNLLMGWLGGRHLKRDTLARYCEERDRDRPHFWFAEDSEDPAEAEDGEDLPETDDGADPAEAAPVAAPMPEPAAAKPPAAKPPATEPKSVEPKSVEPTAMAPAAAEETAFGPDPADHHPAAPTAPSVPAATNGALEAFPEPTPPWPAARRPAPDLSVQPPATTGRIGRSAGRLVGGIALALALLAAGYFVGHGSSGAPPAGPQVAAPDMAPAAPDGELQDDLFEARRQIDTLGAALEASETEVRQLKRDLKQVHQALDTARHTAAQASQPGAQASAPADGASNGPADSEVAALKAELAAARQTIDKLQAAPPAVAQSDAVKRSLIDAAASASSQAMAYKAELRDARERIAGLQRDADMAKAAADALSAELKEARQRPAAAQATSDQGALARAEATRQRAVLAAQIATTQADLSKQELAAVRTRLAHAETEAKSAKADAEAAKDEVARLASELADQRQREAVALGTAAVASEGARREMMLAAQTSSIHVAKLGQDLAVAGRQNAKLEAEARAARSEAAGLAAQLEEARRRNAELEAEARTAQSETVGLAAQLDEARRQNAENLDRLRAEAAARQQELDEAQDRITSLQMPERPSDDESPSPADQPAEARSGSDTVRRAAGGPVQASTRQVAQPSGQPVDLLDASADQEVARQVVRTSALRASSDTAEAIDVDALVTDPGRYDTRRVVVTGALMRLLQNYRLQSQSGVQTLVVDVDGLDREQYDRLRKAIADAGLIGSVEARISGTVERGAAESFRLVASDLKLVE